MQVLGLIQRRSCLVSNLAPDFRLALPDSGWPISIIWTLLQAGRIGEAFSWLLQLDNLAAANKAAATVLLALTENKNSDILGKFFPPDEAIKNVSIVV